MKSSVKRLLFFLPLIVFFFYTFFIVSAQNDEAGSRYIKTGAADGKVVFQQYNCVACHQIYGLGGYMGPDLTNVMSANGKGKGYVRAFLQSGTKRMPNFNLSEEEITALTEYLAHVDKTGISPVRNFTINPMGTVNYDGNK